MLNPIPHQASYRREAGDQFNSLIIKLIKTVNSPILLLLGLLLMLPLVGMAQVIQGKIPINAAYWYQLNSQGSGQAPGDGLAQLTDGIVDRAVFMGWSKLLANYEASYEFRNLTDVTISRIRLYDGTGSFASQPFKLYARDSLTGTPVLLTTFTGSSYRKWVEISFPKPVKAQYLLLNVWTGFPDELELYGSYQLRPPAVLFPRQTGRLGELFGVNSFVWDFTQDPQQPARSDRIFEPKMALMQAFTQYRDYIDWQTLEATPGAYAFNPTQSGGWNYDVLYQRLQQEGKPAVACIKNIPAWFLQTYYPANTGDKNNAPAPYQADRLDPAAYRLYAKLGFQVAARYGHNPNVEPALLDGVVTGPVYPNDPQAGTRTRAIGLGYLTYLECDNEPDMWWHGRLAYETAYEYAAQLSAFYDGHQRRLGPGVGVKNADPTMRVVMGGTAGTSTDYVRGVIDWCKKYRGYRADGSVDLCFDVINYHCYATQLPAAQGTAAPRGAAPELAGVGAFAQAFVDVAREYNSEVWVTEAGYDVNQGSPVHAPAIGSKSAQLVQADWILRTALEYARRGVKRLFMYQTYDLNLASTQQYASAGLLDGPTLRRKPAADFLYQSNKLLGQYVYQETLSQNPLVDRYAYHGQSAYVLVVPDETGRTAPYHLSLGDAGTAKIYQPTPGQDSMQVQTVSLPNHGLDLTVTETPVFVLPGITPAAPPAGPDSCSATGSILWEQWAPVPGSTVAAIPTLTTPGAHEQLSTFEARADTNDYGARIRGYLCPPQSGNYVFSIVADDQGELRLSTDDQPANMVKIAYCTQPTTGSHDWAHYPTQQSAPVPLRAGHRYYIEALQKQSSGTGYLAVAWQLPNDTTKALIPGAWLAPFIPAKAVAPRPVAADSTDLLLLALPNPFTDQVTLEFRLPVSAGATLSVYDVRGRQISQPLAEPVPGGIWQSCTLDTSSLAAGIYIVHLVTDARSLTRRIVLLR